MWLLRRVGGLCCTADLYRDEADVWYSSRIQLEIGYEPGEKLARFVGTYIGSKGQHLVLVPTWTVGESAQLTPNCTAMGYKPQPSVLQHVQPWVACDDTATMYECIRAGKQIVFRSTPATREPWAEYVSQLLTLSDKDTYERMVADLKPAQLRSFGQKHLRDRTPALHAELTERLSKSEQEVVWA